MCAIGEEWSKIVFLLFLKSQASSAPALAGKEASLVRIMPVLGSESPPVTASSELRESTQEVSISSSSTRWK